MGRKFLFDNPAAQSLPESHSEEVSEAQYTPIINCPLSFNRHNILHLWPGEHFQPDVCAKPELAVKAACFLASQHKGFALEMHSEPQVWTSR